MLSSTVEATRTELRSRVAQVHMWCVELTQDASIVDTAMTLLPRQERQRLEHCSSQGLRGRLAVARAALRVLLSATAGIEPSEVNFEYSSNGKPSLMPDRGFGFSVSHSERLAVIATGHHVDLGVDIEYCRPLPNLEDITCSLFGHDECARLAALPLRQREAAFFTNWVRHEALFKAAGNGHLTAAYRSMAFCARTPLLTATLIPKGSAWTVLTFTPADNYCGALACHTAAISLQWQSVDANQLLTSQSSGRHPNLHSWHRKGLATAVSGPA